MSVFTNPSARSVQQAADYTAAVLSLLGDGDPMAVLHETVPALEALCSDLSEEQRTRPEAQGKWSIRHVLQHLADSELVWGYRIRAMLAQDRPRLAGYDQDLWADRLRYDRVPAREALEVFAMLRRTNLRLLEQASDDDLRRTGIHAERGEESLEYMTRLYAGHDLVHLRQVERIRRVLQASPQDAG